MAKAKKLPSGNWRCQVYDYTDGSGKRHYRSFTASTKKEAEYLAAEYAATKQIPTERILDITLSEAVQSYITAKENILSPSTVRGYKGALNLHIATSTLGRIRLSKINNVALQLWISELIQKGMKPKTVKNTYGLVVSSLDMFRPDFSVHVTLPESDPVKRYTPSDEDIKKLMGSIDDKELMAAVLLYAFGPMRRGEICALEDSDIHGNTIDVSKSLVRTQENKWVVKRPKTTSSFRSIDFPDFVIAHLPKNKGRLITVSPDTITHRFMRTVQKLDMPYFTLHDLRHYAASIMHALNVPDKYIMARGGWKTDKVMKSVYQNVIDLEAVIYALNDFLITRFSHG